MTRTIRIEDRLCSAKAAGRYALLPYFTSGFPDLATTCELIRAAEVAGAAVVEIGVPYPDSIADGPVIQSSFNVALARGRRVQDIFDMVREVRPSVRCALTAMPSYSIVRRIDDAFQAGASSKAIVAAVTEFLTKLTTGLVPPSPTG